MIETILLGVFGTIISALLGVGVKALFALTREIGELKVEFSLHRQSVMKTLADHETRLRKREIQDG